MGCRKLQKMSSTGATSFLRLVEEVFAYCDLEEIKQFAGIARRLWLRRNDVVHGKTLDHPTLIVQRTITAVADFSKANDMGAGTQDMHALGNPAKWEAPCVGWKKVNWDASIDKDTGRMGFGILVRDDQGLILAAYSKTIMGRLDPTNAEAKAALLAILLCKQLGLSHVHLEGDAQLVINAILSPKQNWSSMGMLVEDIRQEVQALQHWKISFVRRKGNKAAHNLSRLATRNVMDRLWIHKIPECIADIVQEEHFATSALTMN